MEATEEQQEQELKGLQDEEEGEMLLRRISSHPLYGLLVETHLNCLKVGGIGKLDGGYIAMNLIKQQDNEIRCLNTVNQQPELDRFMESYCFALSKLKEAMEESQLKSMVFISSMHSQLRELTVSSSSNAKLKPSK